MTQYATLARDPLFVPAVGDYYKGMLTSLPLQLGALPGTPKGADIHAAIADHFAAIPGSFVTRRAAGRFRQIRSARASGQ